MLQHQNYQINRELLILLSIFTLLIFDLNIKSIWGVWRVYLRRSSTLQMENINIYSRDGIEFLNSIGRFRL